MKNMLITGASGFLISSIKPLLKEKYNIIIYNQLEQYNNIDIILHFGSPSDDFDFEAKNKTAVSMIDYTMLLLKIAKENNAKFIFASSMGIYEPTNSYCIYKLAMEQYIKDTYTNYLILRIPRVYGKNRHKGLMKKLRLNLIPDIDMNNSIQYLDINGFITQTMDYIDTYRTDNTIEYSDLVTDTIYNIKQKYL